MALDILSISIIASIIEGFLMRRYAIKSPKSYEAKIHNLKVTALSSAPFYILLHLVTDQTTNDLTVGIIANIIVICFDLFSSIQHLKKVHESEMMLERDLSRITPEVNSYSPRINPHTFNSPDDIEYTSEYDPNDDTVVFISSRSNGRKYHGSGSCITYCEATTRGKARSMGLRPCGRCCPGDNFLPPDDN